MKRPNKFVIVREGMGGFLNPPGHAEHTYSIKEKYSNGKEAGHMSLSYAAGSETPWVPDYVKRMAARKLAAFPGEYTEEWEKKVYAHFKGCYQDVERLEYNKPGTLIYPVPYYRLKLEKQQAYIDGADGFRIGRYSQAYLDAENLAIRLFNENEIARAKEIATPENHKAYLFIKGFFPDAKPRLDLIEAVTAASE